MCHSKMIFVDLLSCESRKCNLALSSLYLLLSLVHINASNNAGMFIIIYLFVVLRD